MISLLGLLALWFVVSLPIALFLGKILRYERFIDTAPRSDTTVSETD